MSGNYFTRPAYFLISVKMHSLFILVISLTIYERLVRLILILDYDRLHFCNKSTQLRHFETQLYLAEETKLPMFLHSRNAPEDTQRLLQRYRDRITGGVVSR